ncbi:MAG TPA: DUF4388 domain-containing protein [Candidatus Limnocylindria bacterium]|nr:DUF4388 domain-containing protein [Candidatus Limnocylindria bacterium]
MSAEALRGDLRQFFPAEILQLLQLAQATGRLELERRGEHAEVFVERGRPVFARTTGGSVRAGEILVHRGALSSARLDEALAEQQRRVGQRLGALLIERGTVTPEQVRNAVHEVLRRIVYGLLLWREGTFRFHPGEQVTGEDIQLDLDLDRLILEGLRIADQVRAG